MSTNVSLGIFHNRPLERSVEDVPLSPCENTAGKTQRTTYVPFGVNVSDCLTVSYVKRQTCGNVTCLKTAGGQSKRHKNERFLLFGPGSTS